MGKDDPIKLLAAKLSNQGGLKLWSVIATILGDLSQAGIEQLAGTELTRIMERIGLQPQAMRVALHRLKRDGWIESRRNGRISFHALSKTGFEQTQAVKERVYGSAKVPSIRWRLAVLFENNEALLNELPANALVFPINACSAFTAADDKTLPSDCLFVDVEVNKQPDWLKKRIELEACQFLYEDHATTIETLKSSAIPEDEFDRWVLRILVLHAWRRLVLRSNRVAELLQGEKGAWFHARTLNNALLSELALNLGESDEAALSKKIAMTS